MSKYIKLEDALKAVRDNTMPLDCWHIDRMRAIADLPTIEVSEDCISGEYVKCINCAENGSYKCSKCDGEMYYKYDKDEPQTYITEDRDTQILDAWQVHHRNTTTVENVPSVVPTVRKNRTTTEQSVCDTCYLYNRGIPCGVEPGVCKREVADTTQTDCGAKMESEE